MANGSELVDGAADVVGRKLVIANTPFTVVGVMPKHFMGATPVERPEIYAPLAADPIIDAPRDNIHGGIHGWWLTVMARLKPGVTLEQANGALETVSWPILMSRPMAPAISRTRSSITFTSLQSRDQPTVYSAAIAALVAVACAASLLPALRAARIDPMSAIRCE